MMKEFMKVVLFLPLLLLFVSGCNNTLPLKNISFVKGIDIKLKESPSSTSIFEFSSDGNILAVSSGNVVNLWSIKNGTFAKSFRAMGIVRNIAFSPNNSKVAVSISYDYQGGIQTLYDKVLNLDNNIEIWDVFRNKKIKSFGGNISDTKSNFNVKTVSSISSIRFSSDGKRLISRGNRLQSIDVNITPEEVIWDIKTGKQLSLPSPTSFSKVFISRISPNEKLIAFNGGSSMMELRNIEKNELIYKADSTWGSLVFSPNNRMLAYIDKNNDIVRVISTIDGKLLFSSKVDNKQDMGHFLTFSPDNSWLAFAEYLGKEIKLFSVINNQLTKKFKVDSGKTYGIGFSSDNEFIYMQTDGNLMSWGIKSNKLISNIPYENIAKYGKLNHSYNSVGTALAIRAKDNYFYNLWDIKKGNIISSFYAFDNGKWVVSTPDGYYRSSKNAEEYITADKSKNRPDIIESRLRGIVSPQDTIKTASVTKPTLNTDLQKTTSQPTNISPFPPEFEYEPQYDLPTNCQLPTEQQPTNDKRPRLFIMAVGINDYPTLSKGEQLNYPSKDAEAIVSTFKKMEGRLFSKVHTCLLTSNSKTKPTADRLRDSLRFIRMAGQYDVAILYMAGHAIRNNADKYYFLGSNAKFDKQGFVYPSTVLPWTDIMETLKQPATTLAFIDTCHSGALIGKKSRSINYNDASKLLTQGGTAVLTAASNNESAFEGGGGLTHGYFTHAILQGLEQLKADNNQDGIVTLDELDRYVSSTVSRMSSGQQHPVSLYPETGFDKDIPLWQ